MSNIDFQNGFLCGAATKGLTRSGELYTPSCYNDNGIYSYFYIDFRHALEDFSVGMFNESIIVYDSTQISVSNIELVSTGLYKVTGNIANRYHGITVLNKVTSRLRYTTGGKVAPFSVHFYVAGIDAYADLVYAYDRADFMTFGSITETVEFDASAGMFSTDDILETATWGSTLGSTTETVSVVLT